MKKAMQSVQRWTGNGNLSMYTILNQGRVSFSFRNYELKWVKRLYLVYLAVKIVLNADVIFS